MEAKDTVIKDNKKIQSLFAHVRSQRLWRNACGFPVVDKLLEEQAEISFEAGKQKGRGEVAGWMEKHRNIPLVSAGLFQVITTTDEWQAMLKGWGIK